MELGLEFKEWMDPVDRMEIWDDKKMVMRFAYPHELDHVDDWQWFPALRSVK